MRGAGGGTQHRCFRRKVLPWCAGQGGVKIDCFKGCAALGEKWAQYDMSVSVTRVRLCLSLCRMVVIIIRRGCAIRRSSQSSQMPTCFHLRLRFCLPHTCTQHLLAPVSASAVVSPWLAPQASTCSSTCCGSRTLPALCRCKTLHKEKRSCRLSSLSKS